MDKKTAKSARYMAENGAIFTREDEVLLLHHIKDKANVE